MCVRPWFRHRGEQNERDRRAPSARDFWPLSKCLKGFKQRGISVNLCFKHDSVYTWDEHSREGDRNQEDPGAVHMRNLMA